MLIFWGDLTWNDPIVKVIQNSVKSVFESEKAKCEIIIFHLHESNGSGPNDFGSINHICNRIGFQSIPVEVKKRLG